MPKNFLAVLSAAALTAGLAPLPVFAQGAALVDVAGTYRCQPEPIKCQNPTYSLTQAGNNLQIKADDGMLADAKLTSNITISAGPTFNSLGRILPDRSIEWTNGTRWIKQ